MLEKIPSLVNKSIQMVPNTLAKINAAKFATKEHIVTNNSSQYNIRQSQNSSVFLTGGDDYEVPQSRGKKNDHLILPPLIGSGNTNANILDQIND